MHRVEEDAFFAGSLGARTLVPSAGCVSDSHVADGAGIGVEKLEHQHRIYYAQNGKQTAYQDERVVHVTYGTTGGLLAFEAGIITPATGSSTIEVDLLKNGTSVLASAIVLDSGDDPYELVVGTISTIALADGDILSILVNPISPDQDDYIYLEHFLNDASGTLPEPWGIDAETGNSTEDYVTDQGYGVYSLIQSSDTEAQSSQLTTENHLWIDLFEKPIVTFRVKLDLTGTNALGSADQRLVIGVCSDHTNAEDGLDAVTTNAWFRMEGTSANILVEADDGATDTDDQDSGINLTDNTWTYFKIDFSDLSDVKFSINGVEQSGNTIDMSGIVASTLVQPIFCIQRDGGDEQEKMYIDFCGVKSGLTSGTQAKGLFVSLTLKEDAQ